MRVLWSGDLWGAFCDGPRLYGVPTRYVRDWKWRHWTVLMHGVPSWHQRNSNRREGRCNRMPRLCTWYLFAIPWCHRMHALSARTSGRGSSIGDVFLMWARAVCCELHDLRCMSSVGRAFRQRGFMLCRLPSRLRSLLRPPGVRPVFGRLRPAQRQLNILYPLPPGLIFAQPRNAAVHCLSIWKLFGRGRLKRLYAVPSWSNNGGEWGCCRHAVLLSQRLRQCSQLYCLLPLRSSCLELPLWAAATSTGRIRGSV